jgi:sn-glycerol 3-phosphate transport system ATP-binding protein
VPLSGARVGLRPEAITLDKDGPLRARITHVEYLGADALVDCVVNDAALVMRVGGGVSLAEGDTVRLGFAVDDLHVFDGAQGERRDDLVKDVLPLLRN